MAIQPQKLPENKDYVDTGSTASNVSGALKSFMTPVDFSTAPTGAAMTYGGVKKPVPLAYSGSTFAPKLDEQGNVMKDFPTPPEEIARVIPTDTTSFSAQAGYPTYVSPIDPTKLRTKTMDPLLGGGQYIYDPAQPGKIIKQDADRLYNAQARNDTLSMSSGFFEMDHIVPKWLGGEDIPSNLESLNIVDHDKKTKIHNLINLLYTNVDKKTGKPYLTTSQAKMLALSWRTLDFNLLKNENFVQGFLSGDDAIGKAMAVRNQWDKDQSLLYKGQNYDILRNEAFPSGQLASAEGLKKAVSIVGKWQDPNTPKAGAPTMWENFYSSFGDAAQKVAGLDWKSAIKTTDELAPSFLAKPIDAVIKGIGENVIDPIFENAGAKESITAFNKGLVTAPYEPNKNLPGVVQAIGYGEYLLGTTISFMLPSAKGLTATQVLNNVSNTTRSLIGGSKFLSKLVGLKTVAGTAGGILTAAEEAAKIAALKTAGGNILKTAAIDTIDPMAAKVASNLAMRAFFKQAAEFGAQEVAIDTLNDFYTANDDVNVGQKMLKFAEGAALGGIYGAAASNKNMVKSTSAMFGIPFSMTLYQTGDLKKALLDGSQMAVLHILGSEKLQRGGWFGEYGLSRNVLPSSPITRYHEVVDATLRGLDIKQSKIAREHLEGVVGSSLIKKPTGKQTEADVIYTNEELDSIRQDLTVKLGESIRKVASTGSMDYDPIRKEILRNKIAFETLAMNGQPQAVKDRVIDLRLKQAQDEIMNDTKKNISDISNSEAFKNGSPDFEPVVPIEDGLNNTGETIGNGYLAPAITEASETAKANTIKFQEAYSKGDVVGTYLYKVKGGQVSELLNVLEAQRQSDLKESENPDLTQNQRDLIKPSRETPYNDTDTMVYLSSKVNVRDAQGNLVKDANGNNVTEYISHGVIGSDHSYNKGSSERKGGLNKWFLELGKHEMTVTDADVIKRMNEDGTDIMRVDLVPQDLATKNAAITLDGHYQLIFKMDSRHIKHATEWKNNTDKKILTEKVVTDAPKIADAVLQSEGKRRGRPRKVKITPPDAQGEVPKTETPQTSTPEQTPAVEAPGASQKASKTSPIEKDPTALDFATKGMTPEQYSEFVDSQAPKEKTNESLDAALEPTKPITRKSDLETRGETGEEATKKMTEENARNKQVDEDIKKDEVNKANAIKFSENLRITEESSQQLNEAEKSTPEGLKKIRELSERDIYGKKGQVKGEDVINTKEGIINIARKIVETATGKTKDTIAGRNEKKKLLTFMKTQTPAEFKKIAKEIKKTSKNDEEGFTSFLSRVEKDYKDNGLDANLSAPGVHQAYKRLYQTSVYNEPSQFILHTPSSKKGGKSLFSQKDGVDSPLSKMEKLINEGNGKDEPIQRIVTYQDAPNTPDYKRAKTEDVKTFLEGEGLLPIVTTDGYFGIPITKKLTGGEDIKKFLSKDGAKEKATANFLISIGMDPITSSKEQISKRFKEWNSRQIEDPLDRKINRLVIKKAKTIGEMVDNFDRDYKINPVSKEEGAILDQMKNASGEDGVAHVSLKFIYDTAVAQGRINPKEVTYLKANDFFKTTPEGKAFLQKFSLQAWTPHEKELFETRLGRKLTDNDMVTFGDNVKIGGDQGKDMGSYFEIESPSKALTIEFNHAHEAKAALSPSVLSTIDHLPTIGKLKEFYKPKAKEIVELAKELANINESTNLNDIWKRYGKEVWSEELFGQMGEIVRLGGGAHHLEPTINKILNKKIENYLSGEGVIKGDTLKAANDYGRKKNKDGTFSRLTKKESMISEKSFIEAFGKDNFDLLKKNPDTEFFAIHARYPTSTKSTIFKARVLVDTIHGEGLLDGRIALNPANVKKSEGDFDGDSYTTWPIGIEGGLPKEYGDYIESTQSNGDFLIKKLQKAPSTPLGGKDLLNKINAVGEKNMNAKQGVALTAMAQRIALAAKGNKVKFVLGAEIPGKDTRTISMFENGKVVGSIESKIKVETKDGNTFDAFQKLGKKEVEMPFRWDPKIENTHSTVSSESVDAAGTVDQINRLREAGVSAGKSKPMALDEYLFNLTFPESKGNWEIRKQAKKMMAERFQDIHDSKNLIEDASKINVKNGNRKRAGGFVGAEGEILANLGGIRSINVGGRDSKAQLARRELGSKAVKGGFEVTTKELEQKTKNSDQTDFQWIKVRSKQRIVEEINNYIKLSKKKPENQMWSEKYEAFFPNGGLVKKDVENFYKERVLDLKPHEREAVAVWGATNKDANASGGSNFFLPITGLFTPSEKIARTYFDSEKTYKYVDLGAEKMDI